MTEWLWWCFECATHTEKAPCEHCGAPHDSVLVLPPGTNPPTTEEEADALLNVESYEWPEEAYTA